MAPLIFVLRFLDNSFLNKKVNKDGTVSPDHVFQIQNKNVVEDMSKLKMWQ